LQSSPCISQCSEPIEHGACNKGRLQRALGGDAAGHAVHPRPDAPEVALAHHTLTGQTRLPLHLQLSD